MKYTISLFTTILFSISTFSQLKPDDETYEFLYQEVFEIELSKDNLKENANAWMVKTFKNTNAGIKLNSDDNLIAKGVFDGVFRDGMGMIQDAKFNYIIEVSFKENKYRLTINSFIISPDDAAMAGIAYYGMRYPTDDIEKFKTLQTKYINEMMSGLEKKMLLKRLESPKKILKDIEKQKKYFDVIEPQIKERCTSLSKSLNDYLKKKKKDDW